MKTLTQTQTIWESASRPLFVRSVWIDTSSEGRGTLHRHFILDYEPQEQTVERSKSTRLVAKPDRIDRRESFYNPESYDSSELSTSYGSEESIDNLLLVGSAKIKLQQQPSQNLNKQQIKLLRFYRRPSFTKQPKRQKTEDGYEYHHLNRRMREFQELYSRHSSCQEMQSTLSNACSDPEERLAERVLNWLDMTGKGETAKNMENDISKDKHSKIKESCDERNHQRLQIQKTQIQKQQQANSQRANITKNRGRRKTNSSSRNTTNPTQQSNNRIQQTDGLKPITIIFNRDGFPVRLNRPARDIDFSKIASNSVTSRKFAGSLASASLYKETEAVAYKSRTVRNVAGKCVTKPTLASRSGHTSSMRFGETDKGQVGNYSNKRLHNDMTSSHIQDSKRQLHIFMPSLPKKGINSPSILSGNYATPTADDSSVSVLSRNFNENCKL